MIKPVLRCAGLALPMLVTLSACGGESASPTPIATAPTPTPSPTPSPTPTPTPTPTSVQTVLSSDIEYARGATTSGSIPLLLDIYAPDEACDSNRPTVLYVHGGGFMIGNKAMANISNVADELVPRRINFVSINYRLERDNPVPSAPFAAVRDDLVNSLSEIPNDSRLDAIASAFEDTVAALNFLEANKDTYCIDMDRLGFWGSSAGAATVLQVAYGLNQFGISRPAPRVVVDYWGVLFRASDLEAGEAPFLVLHGTDDGTVDYQNALDLTGVAQNVNVPFAFYTVQNGGHGWNDTGTLTTTVDGRTLLERSADFVEAHLFDQAPIYGSFTVPAP